MGTAEIIECDVCNKQTSENKAEKQGWFKKEEGGKELDFCSDKCYKRFAKEFIKQKKKGNLKNTEEEMSEPEKVQLTENITQGENLEPQNKNPGEQSWVVQNVPAEYKPGVVNVETKEYFVADNLDHARYWAKLLNLQEETKKALVG